MSRSRLTQLALVVLVATTPVATERGAVGASVPHSTPASTHDVAATHVAAVPTIAARAKAKAKAKNPRLIWSDEFTGPAGSAPNHRTWQVMTGGGGWGNFEKQSYTARSTNVEKSGRGRLKIVARRENYTGADGIARQYTSARVMSRHTFKYGYLVARIKLPRGAGLWPAFWTVGSDVRQGKTWPATGEIDIMEAINQMSFVNGALHGPNTAAQHSWQAYSIDHRVIPKAGWTAKYHRFGVYWTKNSITWYLDGKPYGTVRRAELSPHYLWEFSKPHVAILNLAVGGQWPGEPTSKTPKTSVMRVDYVRLYSHPKVMPRGA